jgi:hypothetical protein
VRLDALRCSAAVRATSKGATRSRSRLDAITRSKASTASAGRMDQCSNSARCAGSTRRADIPISRQYEYPIDTTWAHAEGRAVDSTNASKTALAEA